MRISKGKKELKVYSSNIFTDINHEIDFVSSTFIGEGDIFTGSTFLEVNRLDLKVVEEGPKETNNTTNVGKDDREGN